MKPLVASKYLAVSLVFACMLAVVSSPLTAQYFGRNKVQYERFNFKVLKTEHFDVYYYPEMQAAAQQAARMAERWYKRLSQLLEHELRGRQPLILYANSPHFQQTTAIAGSIGEGTGGVTEMFKRRIVLPMGPSLAASDHVIGHELVHAFQIDMTSAGASTLASATPTAMRLPLWMIEGMAEYMSIGHDDAHTAMWMRDAVRKQNEDDKWELPTIKKLADSYTYFPYRWGQSLWSYIAGNWGDDAVSRIIKSAGRMGGYEAAIRRVTGKSQEELSKEWHEAMTEAYQPLIEKTDLVDPDGELLIKGTKYNVLNVSPALSPDGSKLVLLSTKDLFSIDLFLVDARTGKFEKKLISTASDPEFESLQFIKSAGSWDASGKRFVFGAVSRGKALLSIFDMERKKRIKEIVFDQSGEILSPTWSPDGRRIAFSAQSDGYTDLFMFDLETESLEYLTNDPYADLMPDWSPDGRSIAFITERFNSEMAILDIGAPQIAIMNVETGMVRQVPAFAHAKNLNPQWAPDSASLYFVSDQNGIPNVYNVEVRTGRLTQVTNLFSGVSGITPSSPAITVAQDSGTLAFTQYDDGKYSIYTIDQSKLEGKRNDLVVFEGTSPSVLPPRTDSESEVIALLKNPLFGLTDGEDFEPDSYRPKLKLDYVSQPQLGVGIDRFGTYAAGGITLNFSDMLGYHNLATSVMTSSRIQDTAAVVAYMNARSRLNWGASLQRIPYVYGGYTGGFGSYFGVPAFYEQEIIYRQVNYDASTFASYPLSQVQRFELWGGFRAIDFQRETRTRIYSELDGMLLAYEKENLPAPESLYMGYMNAALVYDTSLFGATAPILGQSYILQASPYIGTMNYWNVLADFRRYLMPVKPFTLAFRLMHFGRYGLSADENRFYPIFLGYEHIVRGYNSGSLSAAEGDVYSRLLGDRILVGNIELRFPLFQVLGLGQGWYGILPMDFTAFFDTGLAWYGEGDARPWFMGGKRRPVSSAGVGLRMNLFGYLILGVSYVYPFDRPEQGPYFQFTLFPGF
jgi:Tol biopolymer transport system component